MSTDNEADELIERLDDEMNAIVSEVKTLGDYDQLSAHGQEMHDAILQMIDWVREYRESEAA